MKKTLSPFEVPKIEKTEAKAFTLYEIKICLKRQKVTSKSSSHFSKHKAVFAPSRHHRPPLPIFARVEKTAQRVRHGISNHLSDATHIRNGYDRTRRRYTLGFQYAWARRQQYDSTNVREISKTKREKKSYIFRRNLIVTLGHTLGTFEKFIA